MGRIRFLNTLWKSTVNGLTNKTSSFNYLKQEMGSYNIIGEFSKKSNHLQNSTQTRKIKKKLYSKIENKLSKH